MKRSGKVTGFCLLAGALLLAACWTVQLTAANTVREQPRLNRDKPWRIAYCESGRFANYAGTLHSLARGLSELGLVNAAGCPFPADQKDTRMIWNWLGANGGGRYLEFVPDAYYSLELGDEAAARATVRRIIERFNTRHDVDLLIVMGTQAGKLLANDEHTVPTMVFSTSDAVAAGIVKTAGNSGRAHVWGHVDPGRYRRQLEIFHDLFAFKKLGIVYDDTPDGRLYAAVSDVEKVAAERGFTVCRTTVRDRQANRDAHVRQMAAAYKALLDQGIDALYSGLYMDRNVKDLPELYRPLHARDIPIFAQQGAAEVRHGALLSVARADFTGIGRFGARTMAQIFRGKRPGQLPQIYENSPNIVLNWEVATKIHYLPPFEILLVSDEIYQKIE